MSSEVAAEVAADTIAPTLDRVLIRRHQTSGFTAGGLYIPESARKPRFEGTVVAVGPGKPGRDCQVLPMWVEPGMEVAFRHYCYTEVPDSEDLVIVNHDDILAQVVLPELPPLPAPEPDPDPSAAE